MKRSFFISILLSVCLLAAGQNFDTSHSYVSKRIYLNEEGTKYIDNVTYLDGFGRKLQKVQVKGSPDGTSDLVQPYSYGKMGRTERTFLPYAKANNNGAFVANPLNAANWNAYGTADAAYAFTKTEYDNSPLNRIVSQTGPGAAWHTEGKAVTTTHDMNAANEVRLYRVDHVSGVLRQDGFYRRGSLEKLTTTDEDGHTTETFTDNQGKTILTVVVNGEERLETYYVYDYRELLRWVLSPEASHRIASSIDTEALYKYAYYYEYDALKRMTFKKLPGCEPVYMVYDKRDRLVLTQDGNMRAINSNRWSYTEYNTKNRPIESGEIVLSASATHTELIASMMKSESLPSGTRTPLQYIRYDKYTANEHVTPHTIVAVPGYANDYHRLTVGLVTATKTRVLDTDQWITSTIYYDSKCRPMQEITDNLVGGVSRVTHSYDFVGNIVKSKEAHGANTLEYAYTYDDRSRLLNVTASFNGATPITLKSLEYDEVGRLKKVNLHNNTTSSEYDYNIRNWLTEITGSKFSQSLTYGNGNGNIRSMNWSADGSSHSYAFTYDGANRMLDAIHGTGAYTEKVTNYDKNGNILGLQRYGGSLIDNLAYTYSGNQLTQVEDATGNSAGFNNGASTANEYTYDYNGNLTKDSNKGICNIAWNSLNLPNVVTFEDGSTVTYLYAADGTRLRTLHNINGATTTKDYCGSVIYENGTAKFWQTEAGYISMNDSKFHYYLQDHQGNNRVVVSENGTAEEVNHYYAFGGLFGNSNSVQPFKYNGKELDTKKDLNWYDYGARQYDAALGRWFAVDPLAEKYYQSSPYNYCDNNPIGAIDVGGKLIIFINGFAPKRENRASINYWSADFVNKVKEQLNDNNVMFRHGGVDTDSKSRMQLGALQAIIDAPEIVKSITNETGGITESIKVISHSMGGSFAKGYVTALLNYFKNNNLTNALVTLEADFDPFQANTLSVIDNVFTQQFTHNRLFEGDYWYLANKRQDGLKHYYNDIEQGSHSITSFLNDISKLKEGTYLWNGENWILKD